MAANPADVIAIPVAMPRPRPGMARRCGSIAWVALLATLTAYYLHRSGADLRGAVPLLRQAQLEWIAGAVLIQFAIVGLIAGMYRTLLSRLGSPVPRRAIARAHLRRHLAGTVIPFGGPVGLVWFARDLRAHDVNGSTVVYSSLLATVVNEIAFALVLIPTIGWLALAGRATQPMVAGAVVLTAIALLGLGGIALAIRRGSPRLEGSSRFPDRLRAFLREARAHELSASDLLTALPFAMAVNLCGVAMLACALMAAGQHLSVTTILAARVTVSMAGLLVPFFQGAGAVELGLVGALHAGGVPLHAALAGTVLFRATQFWLPLFLGCLALIPWLRVWRVVSRTAPA